VDPLTLLSSAAAMSGRGQLRRQVPAAALVFLIVALVVAGAPAGTPDATRVLDWTQKVQGVELALLVLAVAATSVFLQPVLGYFAGVLQGTMLTGPILTPARTVLIAHHRRTLLRDQDQRIELLRRSQREVSDRERTALTNLEIRLSRSPTLASVAPTALGNILVAADEYPWLRYSLDTRVALPRLQLLVPAEALALLQEQRDDLQFATQLAAALIVGSAVSAVLLVTHPVWLALPATVLLLAWLAYRNALAAGVQYGEVVRVLFDLYRFRLYDALQVPRPPDTETEHEEGKQITTALWRGVWPGGRRAYTLPSEEKTTGTDSE
jgi:hypothetical protein